MLKEDVGRRKEELEGDLNGALDTVSTAPGPPGLAELTFQQFESLIERLANLHATAHPPPSASATHALERHREVYAEYQKEYQRTRVRLKMAAFSFQGCRSADPHANVHPRRTSARLSSARTCSARCAKRSGLSLSLQLLGRRSLTLIWECSAFKSSNNSSATDQLLSERNHIDNSHRMLDDIMGSAISF